MKARSALINTHALLNPTVNGPVTSWERYSFGLVRVGFGGSLLKVAY